MQSLVAILRLLHIVFGVFWTPAEAQELGALSRRLTLYTRVVAALLLLAVAAMAVARNA